MIIAYESWELPLLEIIPLKLIFPYTWASNRSSFLIIRWSLHTIFFKQDDKEFVITFHKRGKWDIHVELSQVVVGRLRWIENIGKYSRVVVLDIF